MKFTAYNFLKQEEGVRLRAYQDSIGVWTIGVGHTEGVKPGDVITQTQVDKLLDEDLRTRELALNKMLTRAPTQNQYDAMISLLFNIGQTNFAKSSLLRKFNSGDIQGAADAFLLYKYAGGKPSQALLNRRSRERALFLTKDRLAASVEPPTAPSAPVTSIGSQNSQQPVGGFLAWLQRMFGGKNG